MRAAGVLLFALLPACAGKEPVAAGRGTGSADPNALVIVSPARWEYHPAAPDTATSALVLDRGECLVTSPGGQRWLITPEPSTDRKKDRVRCAGRAESASDIAAEDLVAVLRRPTGFAFVDASGAVHEADKPLGPFTKTEPSKAHYARVAGAGDRLLAATSGGRVHRWEEGKGFRPVQPLPGRVFDVALDARGRALALAFPEALFASSDAGATWTAISAPPVGARHVGLTSKGELAAQGLFESLVFQDPTSAPARVRKQVLQSPVQMDADAGHRPTAGAVREGRAAIDGDRYVEAIRADEPASKADGDWTLGRGKLEGRLETVKLPFRSCDTVRLGLRGANIYAACIKGQASKKDDVALVQLRRSIDMGSSWSPTIELRAADVDAGPVSVSPSGAAMLTGVCASADASGGCKPLAPLLVRAAGNTLRAIVSAAPQLAGPALLPAFSFDGRSAYFLGKRGKDERITLFVSHDGGESFSQRPLAQPQKAPPPNRQEEDGEEESHEPSSDSDLDVDDTSFAQAADDGTVGFLLRGGTATYVLADDDGRVLQTTAAPNENAMVAGYGRRLIAMGPPPNADARPVSSREAVGFWESTDAGSTWEERAYPLALARAFGQSAPLACGGGGCLIGDSITRMGWGGSTSAQEVELAPRLPSSEPKVRIPITCDLAPSSRWTRIDNVHPDASPLPNDRQALRGKSFWSFVTEDLQSGAIGAVSASLPDGGDGEARINNKQLLGAIPPGGHFATMVSHQVEGYLVIRVPFPVDAKGEFLPGGPMRNVEIVWENYLEGTSGRARIADAGAFEKDDVQTSGYPLPRLRPGLVTLSVRSVYVRPHHESAKNQTVFSFDSAGKGERHFVFPKTPDKSLFGELAADNDAATVDDKPFFVGLVPEVRAKNQIYTGTVLLARSGASGGWDFTATSIAPSRGEDGLLVHTSWAYLGKSTIGLFSLVSDPKQGEGWASFNAFRPDGAAVPSLPVPTVLDLPDRPKPCSAAERQATPRVEASSVLQEQIFFPGTRHPVLVHEPPVKGASGVSVPMTLLTTGAIVHGTPAAPCVAAWEAQSLKGAPQMGAILSGDLARSWLFRVADRPSNSRRPPGAVTWPSVEARPMACRFEPAARIPENVWSEPGTARRVY